MSTFRLPDLGEGLAEAEIVAWHVKVGDHVRVDQPMVSVETAKAVVEVPAPFGGVVKESERDVLHELRLTRAWNATESLPWLVRAARDSTGFDLRPVLAGTVRSLRSDLVTLGYVEP